MTEKPAKAMKNKRKTNIKDEGPMSKFARSTAMMSPPPQESVENQAAALIFLVIANEGFPHISEKILAQLSNKDLCSMRLVCKTFGSFMAAQKFWHQRILTKILAENNNRNDREYAMRRVPYISSRLTFRSGGLCFAY